MSGSSKLLSKPTQWARATVRRTSTRQQNRDNVKQSTLNEYFRRSITVPFLDYLVAGMKERFSGTSSQVSSLLCLVHKVMESTDKEETFKQLGKPPESVDPFDRCAKVEDEVGEDQC